MAKIIKEFEDVKNSFEIHNEIIKEVNKITGQKTPIMIQTNNGKLIKIEVDSKQKNKEIKVYLETLE